MYQTPGMYQTKADLVRGMGAIAICVILELATAGAIVWAIVQVVKAVS